MTRRLATAWLAALAGILMIHGCGGDSPTVPTTPTRPELFSDPGSLFLEPEGFCLAHDQASDTLFVRNLGDTVLVWLGEDAPAGSENLAREVRIDPGTVAAILWTWNPAALPAADSLVAYTSDPSAPRVVLPFRRTEEGFVDSAPPPAPRFVTTGGFTAVVERPFDLEWSRVHDCTGISRYEFQVSSDPAFPRDRTFTQSWGITAVSLIAEASDIGPGYARVRAVDRDFGPTTGRPGPWSETISWTVAPASP
jgi:hypothetical protein